MNMSGIRNSTSNLIKSLSSEDNPPGRRVISHAASQSVRPYGSNQEYLYAMREDLADWLKGLYAVDITVGNFFTALETGTLLCQHANNITTCAEYIRKNNMKVEWKYAKKFPTKYLLFNQGKYVRASSFFTRDNIATFIDYCRSELEIPESVMFESNDLVLRRNEKNVILCLLEVARRGSKFGVPAPVLIQMEEDIDKEIEMEKVAKEQNEPPPEPVKQRVNCDFKSLDEMVQHILGMCTCPNQFPMVKVSDGKYKVGDSENLIFMRILRQHVMVRVGGGWDTLEHYLNKHDPCRCFKHKNDRSLTARRSRTQSASGRQSQAGNNLTASGTLLKAATANNRRQLGNSRLAKSANNLTDIGALSTFEKPVSRHSNVATRSRNSSVSDTSISDTRVTKAKPKKTTEPSPTKTPRTSTNKRIRQSTPSEDVFSRLYRPKSTPPVSRQTMSTPTFQNDLLLVQRNKTGGHRVQRSTIAGPPPRQSTFTRTKATPTLRNEPKAMNSTKKPVPTTTPRTSRSEKRTPAPTTPRTRQTITATNRRVGRESRPRPLSARLPKSSSFDLDLSPKTKPAEPQVVDDKEREKLEAFEKECISNKLSLEMKENNHRRKSSTDTVSEMQRQLSRSSAEDNEVAMHMQQLTEKPSRPAHPPSAFTLPRPRKDKVNKHEHPTRIPTPISFSRPLLQRKDTEDTILKKQQAVDLSDSQPLLNGKSNDITGDVMVSKQPPSKAPLSPSKVSVNLNGKPLQNGRNHNDTAEDRVSREQDFVASFSVKRSLQNGKSNSFNDDVDGESSSNFASKIKNDMQTPPKEKVEPQKRVTNGAAGDFPAYAHPNLRQPRIEISVDEINRLLNSSKANVEKYKSKSKPARGILTEYPPESSSSGKQELVTSNPAPSAFVRVDNRLNGDPDLVVPNSRQQKHSSFRHPPTAYPGKSQHSKPPLKHSVSVDLNDNIAGYHGDKPDFSEFFKQGGLKNSVLASKVKQNGFKFNQASPDEAKVVWV